MMKWLKVAVLLSVFVLILVRCWGCGQRWPVIDEGGNITVTGNVDVVAEPDGEESSGGDITAEGNISAGGDLEAEDDLIAGDEVIAPGGGEIGGVFIDEEGNTHISGDLVVEGDIIGGGDASVVGDLNDDLDPDDVPPPPDDGNSNGNDNQNGNDNDNGNDNGNDNQNGNDNEEPEPLKVLDVVVSDPPGAQDHFEVGDTATFSVYVDAPGRIEFLLPGTSIVGSAKATETGGDFVAVVTYVWPFPISGGAPARFFPEGMGGNPEEVFSTPKIVVVEAH